MSGFNVTNTPGDYSRVQGKLSIEPASMANISEVAQNAMEPAELPQLAPLAQREVLVIKEEEIETRGKEVEKETIPEPEEKRLETETEGVRFREELVEKEEQVEERVSKEVLLERHEAPEVKKKEPEREKVKKRGSLIESLKKGTLGRVNSVRDFFLMIK